jgi:hypothetical protein
MKKKYTKEAEIPAEVRAFYARSESGEFTLHPAIIEDMSEAEAEIAATRQSNIESMKGIDVKRAEIEKLKAELARFDGIDVSRIAENTERVRRFEEASLLANGGGEILRSRYARAAEERLAIVKSEAAAETAKRDARLKELDEQISSLVIDEAVAAVARDQGARSEAIEDIVARARADRPGCIHFELDDRGQPHAVLDDGPAISATTMSPVSIPEFVASIAKIAPHLFQDSRGGGASAAGGSSLSELIGSGPNPYAARSFNLTMQSRIERENPARAELLRSQARR